MLFIRTSDEHRICLTVPCNVEIADGLIGIQVLDSQGRYVGQSDFYFPTGTKLEVVEKDFKF